MKKQNRSGQRGQRNRGGRGTCVGVTGRTYAGDSRDRTAERPILITSSANSFGSLVLSTLSALSLVVLPRASKTAPNSSLLFSI